MIDIEEAIRESKSKENISDGGSKCFDFGDVVLVKYTCDTKYLRDGERARPNSEDVMIEVNKKNRDGVNTPKHYAVKRVVEGKDDVCYVLQEKVNGINCEGRRKYKLSFEDYCKDLEFLLNIPLEHYKKLISDGCQLYKMNSEVKNKNMFYDEKTGFWYIDFIGVYNTEFDPNNPEIMFETLLYKTPNPLYMASSMDYKIELTEEEQAIRRQLEYALKGKVLTAIKEVLPTFNRYEKFFLLKEKNSYKKYLMKNGITDKDLINVEESDYEVFSELYEIMLRDLAYMVAVEGKSYSSIAVNELRILSDKFNLKEFFEKSRFNTINKKDFENTEPDPYGDPYAYKSEVDRLFYSIALSDLANRLEVLEKNDYIIDFLNNYGTNFGSSGLSM